MSTADILLHDVLALPTKKRAEIALRIMESLDGEPAQEVEDAWAVEVRDRVEALRVGTASTKPAAEVFNDARKKLRDRR